MTLGPHVLVLTIPLGLGAVVGLVVLARRLAARVRHMIVLRVPIAPEQEIELAPGRWVLHLDGPHFSTRFRGLDFALVERMTHRAVPLRRILLRTHVSTFSRVLLAVRRLVVELPGTHVLTISGLRPGTDYSDCGIAFSRPYGAMLVAHILGFLALGGLAIASLLTSIAATVGLESERGLHGGALAPALPADIPAAGGRALRSDGAPEGWREFVWAAQKMWVRLPPGWQVRASSDRELDIRPGRPTPYLIARVTPADLDATPETLLGIYARSAAEQLARGEIDGWEVRTLGTVTGVATVSAREQRLAWSGFRGTGSGQQLVTVLLGAPENGLDGAEPTLGGILDSVRFE